MKKRAYMLALLLCVTLAAAGCKQKTEEEQKPDNKTEETSNTEELDPEQDTEEEEAETPKTVAQLMEDIDIAKCVTLGTYKGITVDKPILTVTDEAVEKEIQTALAAYPVEVEGAVAKTGDTVNIDYVGRLDGEEFEGGSDQGKDLMLGSNNFIPGFEDGLIGATEGETRTLDLTFPNGYTQELSGKAVQFTVTVNKVKVPLEEATDEWVAANIEGYYTVDEYKESIRSKQQEKNEQEAEKQLRYLAWTQVVDNSTINEYPETLVEMGRQLYSMEVELYAKLSGMELEEFLKNSDMTMEDYQAKKEEYGKAFAGNALVNRAICEAEGFAIGDEAYQAELEKMAAEYGKTEEELLEKYGQDNLEQSIMVNRVCTLILDNATINDVTAEAETGTEE